MEKRADFEKLLKELTAHAVEFIVVGGVAAVLQGAPIMTLDLAIVYKADHKNLTRLLKALERLHAFYRTHPEKRLKPGRTHLETLGHQLLLTEYGPLDILGRIGTGSTYDELLPFSRTFEIESLSVRVNRDRPCKFC